MARSFQIFLRLLMILVAVVSLNMTAVVQAEEPAAEESSESENSKEEEQ